MSGNWKLKVVAKIRRITPDEAKAILKTIQPNIGSLTIRSLTGGYSSQSIDAYVIRKLGIKAGIINEVK